MFCGLVLGGGFSSRMKTDKGALQFQGSSLREKAYGQLQSFCDKTYQSLRKGQLGETFAKSLNKDLIILDRLEGIGPAAALLAAYEFKPEAVWFILACDFPLADQEACRYLKAQASLPESLDSEVICYQHQDGTPEPLFAIWKPSALQKLQQLVREGHTGPMSALKKSNPLLVKPVQEKILFNANTPEDWSRIQALIKS